MSNAPSSRDLGPIDSRSWPGQLEAHAVDVEAAGRTRMFGYDVERDVAAFYRFSDLIFLSLTGQLPDEAHSRAFEVAMCFAAPMSIAHAGVHAASLARLCGARPSGVLSAAGLVLGEDASAIVASVGGALAAWEDAGGEGMLPAPVRAASEGERASVAALAALLRGVLHVPALSADPCRDAALLAVFRACGILEPFPLASLLALARLPSALAEAVTTRPGSFPAYPLDTPHFEYVAPECELR